MPATKAVVTVAGVLVAAAVTAAETLPPPQGVWPVTVTGWLTSGTSVVALVVALYNVHRHRVQGAVKEAQDDAKMAAVGEKIERLRLESSDEMSRYRLSVKLDLDGYGRRLVKVEEATGADREVVNGVLQSLAEARENRKHVGETLERIERRLEDMNRGLFNRTPLP